MICQKRKEKKTEFVFRRKVNIRSLWSLAFFELTISCEISANTINNVILLVSHPNMEFLMKIGLAWSERLPADWSLTGYEAF